MKVRYVFFYSAIRKKKISHYVFVLPKERTNTLCAFLLSVINNLPENGEKKFFFALLTMKTIQFYGFYSFHSRNVLQFGAITGCCMVGLSFGYIT